MKDTIDSSAMKYESLPQAVEDAITSALDFDRDTRAPGAQHAYTEDQDIEPVLSDSFLFSFRMLILHIRNMSYLLTLAFQAQTMK